MTESCWLSFWTNQPNKHRTQNVIHRQNFQNENEWPALKEPGPGCKSGPDTGQESGTS